MMMGLMKSIRGGRGLGDAFYVQAVARHIIKTRNEKLKVCADWPDVFRPLGNMVTVVPHTRVGVNILAHYSSRKGIPETDQFVDCCISAGVREPVELKLDWAPIDLALIDSLKSFGKPIVCVQMPRPPMDRKDGFGAELLPDCMVTQRVIDSLKDRAVIVQIGSGKALFDFAGIDVDLSNKTKVSQLIDVGWAADAFLGQCSFIIPLAESFDKPAMLVWSSRGMKSQTPFIRQITPSKVLHKPSCRHIVDDWSQAKIDEAMRDFLL